LTERGYRKVTKGNNLVYNLFVFETGLFSHGNHLYIFNKFDNPPFCIMRKMTGGSLTEEEIQEYVETQVEISTASVRTELDPFKTVVETNLDSIEKSQEIRFDSVDKRIDSLSW